MVEQSSGFRLGTRGNLYWPWRQHECIFFWGVMQRPSVEAFSNACQEWHHIDLALARAITCSGGKREEHFTQFPGQCKEATREGRETRKKICNCPNGIWMLNSIASSFCPSWISPVTVSWQRLRQWWWMRQDGADLPGCTSLPLQQLLPFAALLRREEAVDTMVSSSFFFFILVLSLWKLYFSNSFS